ncbi:MAG: TIGR03936 family radical SAM-associated protein [Eubacteriales bacterium]|nr:TIGR03936 family radical SAM-associated protein [Eubacteriales bacterium]
MKVRIKFAKQGVMKFIGHLDVMRYFQKAMRRANIDIAFSEGFSPHMIMSFAAPLGVGLTSDGEYLDIELRTPISSEQALKQLNAVMVEGMQVLSFRQVPDGKVGNAMALVAAADYTLRFRDDAGFAEGWQSKLADFYAQPCIHVIKKTKKSEVETDIRPMIYDLHAQGDTVHMTLATGSAANLKPELVMDAFAAYLGEELGEFVLLINRNEVYADAGKEGARYLVSLESLGEDIL